MDGTLPFFGYGVLSDRGVVAGILGRPEGELVGTKVTLEGYGLAVQRLDQISDKPILGTEITARGLLQKVWGKEFSSYVLVPNPDGKVAGIAWEVTQEELDRLNDWVLTGCWHEEAEGKARTNEGVEITVKVAKIDESQEVDHFVNGLDYKIWLSGAQEDFIKAGRNAKLEYDKRMLRSPEETANNPGYIEVMR